MELVVGKHEDWKTTNYPRHVSRKAPTCNEDEVYICGCNLPEYEKKIIIPNMIDDKKVIGIDGEAFVKYKKISWDEDLPTDNPIPREIIVTPGIRYIGMSAFLNCVYLSKVTLPDGITRIERQCYSGCRSLETINLPEGIEYIDTMAFAGCKALKRIHFPSTLKAIGVGSFSICGFRTLVLNEGLEYIEDGAFGSNDELTAVTISRSVSEIAENAFMLSKVDRVTGRVNDVKNENLTFYCYPGSYGLIFARENGHQVKNADI